MQFFDLNIPYLESNNSIPNTSSKKQTRLKQIVKSMELGYTGIAYNQTIKGSMSEFDRCTISPFPLCSLLKFSPSLSSMVAFHRRILGVPFNAAFKQYTRLTIVIENSAQCSALNSGNPILKSYDFVAVRPLNQNCFDLACQSSQVDLISIDFSEKLPFRLKHPMVKAAIARGVYFEITYSSLLQDVQVRRQMISNAKLLVDWTRGKNLIVASAAPSVLELRGPNDVANLLSLLGLSNERAKATISKNCRLLLTNVLRKKQFYKEAIRVEAIPYGVQTNPKEPWIVDHVDWDPLSSGEGDLVLDDIAKAFAESGKVSQTVKVNDLSNCVDKVESHGLHVTDLGLRTDEKLCASDNNMGIISTSKDVEFLKNTGDSEKQLVEHCETSDLLETITSPVRIQGLEMQSHIGIHENNLLFSDQTKQITSKDGCNAGQSNEIVKDAIERLNCNGEQTDDLKEISGFLNSIDSGISTEVQICSESNLIHSPNVSMAGNSLVLKEDFIVDEKSILPAANVMDSNLCMEINNIDGLSLGGQNEDYSVVKIDAKESVVDDTIMLMEPVQLENNSNDLSDDLTIECGKQVQEIGDTIMVMEPLQPENGSNELSDDSIIEYGKQVQEIGNAEYKFLDEEKLGKAGKRKLKNWDAGQVLRFPFKRLVQVQFKKKGRNLKCKTRKRE